MMVSDLSLVLYLCKMLFFYLYYRGLSKTPYEHFRVRTSIVSCPKLVCGLSSVHHEEPRQGCMHLGAQN